MISSIRSSLVLALVMTAWAGPVRAHTAAEEMAGAAEAFLAALAPEQRTKAAFEFKEEERVNWHFIPKSRKGFPFKEMSPEQRQLAHALLSSGLSARGAVKAATIMSLEQVLRELEKNRGQFSRDPELYYVSVFGKPGGATWGWRVEGHHLSVNFTVTGGKDIAGTPSFLGTNPAEVREGPRRGLRVLAAEEDLARALLAALPEDQRKTAIITNVAYKDILTMNQRTVSPLAKTGLLAAEMPPAQRRQLWKLIEEYVRRNRAEVAEADLAKIERAGLEKVYFAWAGSVEKGQGHYYRVQGPTFLLEYDCTQNDANHVHAVWRDFANDFGDDLLRRHYAEQPHGKAE